MLGLGLNITKKSGVDRVVNASIQNTKGFVFDGTGDFLTVPNHNDFSFSTPTATTVDSPFSFAVWLKRDSVGVNEAIFSKAAASNFEYRIFALNNDIYCDTYDTSASSYTRRSKLNVMTTDWQHWIFAYSGDISGGNPWTIYRNGIALTSLGSGGGYGGDMENLGAAFKVGAMDDTGYDYQGKMMQAVLWNKEITAGEAKYLYADGAAHRDPMVATPAYSGHNNVVGWWPLDDANGHEDHGTNGHDFTKVADVDLDSSTDSPF